MSFHPSTYANFVSAFSPAQERLFLQYLGNRSDFDIILIGSGIGGGLLADDLANRLGKHQRILVLEAGAPPARPGSGGTRLVRPSDDE